MSSQKKSLPPIEIRDGHRPIRPSTPHSPPTATRAAAPAPFPLRNDAAPPAAHEAPPAPASAILFLRLINPQTGEIVFWTSDTGIDGQTPVDLDELDLVCIDPLPSWVWYQDMADFAEAITDDRAGRRLARAIQGKGAFRRFKDELQQERPDLLAAWYAFRDARAVRRAVQWLADNSLIDDDAANRFLADHPDPDLP
jgi:hypothetical protein